MKSNYEKVKQEGRGEFLKRKMNDISLEQNLSTFALRIKEAHTKDVVGEVEKLKKDEYPRGDGVSVETYGHIVTHNQALDDLLKEIKQ